MKVNAYKNIDVECEVDVSLDDCINEMLSVVDEEGIPHAKLAALNGATKILEAITPDMVGEYLKKYPEALEMIKDRIRKWSEAT